MFGINRYIRTSDIKSELFCVLERGGGGPKTGLFHENVLRMFQICDF